MNVALIHLAVFLGSLTCLFISGCRCGRPASYYSRVEKGNYHPKKKEKSNKKRSMQCVKW